MGYSQHAGMVIVADGTRRRRAPARSGCCGTTPRTGVMRHADAGYDIAIDCAREQGLDLPMIGSAHGPRAKAGAQAALPRRSLSGLDPGLRRGTGEAMLKLNPEAIDLATLRQLWQGEAASLDDASMQRIAESAAAVERIVAGGRDRLRRQHRLRPARQHPHPQRPARRAPDQPDPVAQRRPRRAAPAPRHAADDRAQAARPRPRLFGRSPARHRRAAAAARCRRDAGHPVAGKRRRDRATSRRSPTSSPR